MGKGGAGPASGDRGASGRSGAGIQARPSDGPGAGGCRPGSGACWLATAGAASVSPQDGLSTASPESASQQHRPDVTVPAMEQATGCAAAAVA